MSAESEIAALITLATLAAEDFASTADSLVNEATGVLDQEIEWPLPPGAVTNESRAIIGPATWGGVIGPRPLWGLFGGVSEEEPPDGFPAWPTMNLEGAPNTQALDEITLADDDALEFPTLLVPAFIYPAVAAPPNLNATLPSVDTSLTLPEQPNVDLPDTPIWKPLRTITEPTLTVDAPSLAAVNTDFSFDSNLFNDAFDRFKTSIFGGTENLPGLTELLADQTAWSDGILKDLLPRLLEILQQRFDSKYAGIFAYYSTLQERLTARLTAEQDRALLTLVDSSGWERPQAVQLALEATAMQIAATWASHAESQVSTRAEELILQFFEFCGSLFTKLQSSVLELKGKQIELSLEAHKWALTYAKQALAAALAIYEATQFTVQGLMIQRSEAELAVAEAELKLAMTRFVVADSQLQIQQAQQEQNTLLVQQYGYERDAAQIAVSLYAEQVSAARSELAIKKLPLVFFEAQIKAFEASISAHEAIIAARVAEVDNDIAKASAEVAKVKVYAAEVKAFENKVMLQQQIIAGQAERNDAVVEEYTARVKAALAPLQLETLESEYDFTKYEVLANNALADARLALDQAKVDLEWKIKEQEGKDKAYEFTQRRALDLMNVELKRLDAIAAVNAQGAGLIGNMAEGAMTTMDSIASVIYKEEA